MGEEKTQNTLEGLSTRGEELLLSGELDGKFVREDDNNIIEIFRDQVHMKDRIVDMNVTQNGSVRMGNHTMLEH